MNLKKKIWRGFKVLTLLFFLFIGVVVVFVLNAYKLKITNKEFSSLVTAINQSPSYPDRFYLILGNTEPELDTSLTETDCWVDLRPHRWSTSPARRVAWYSMTSGLYTVSLALKLDRTVNPKKMVNYNLSKVSFGLGQRSWDSAAYFYYKKTIDSLSDKEFISLGCITRAPSKFNPVQNPELNKKRTDVLIRQLKQRGIKLDNSCNHIKLNYSGTE